MGLGIPTSQDCVKVNFDAPPAWSTNQDRNLHHHKRAQRILEWKEATILALHGQPRYDPPRRLLVALTIPFKQNRRRDPHNYCGTVLKAVIDGIVHAGFVPDDNPKWIAHREPVFAIGTAEAELELWPIDELVE